MHHSTRKTWHDPLGIGYFVLNIDNILIGYWCSRQLTDPTRKHFSSAVQLHLSISYIFVGSKSNDDTSGSGGSPDLEAPVYNLRAKQ